MVSKSPKIKAASSSKAGASGHSADSTASPTRPTRLTRIDEKNTLISLNDRLAACIDRNQQLKNENDAIAKQLAKAEERMSQKVAMVRKQYSDELLHARRMIDEVAKNRTRLELDNHQLRKGYQDAEEKLDKKTKECAAATKNYSQTESRFQDLTAEINKLTSEHDAMINEREELQTELKALKKENDRSRRMYSQEILIRSDLEGRLMTKSQELNFKIRCHEEEMSEIQTRRSQEIQEVDGRLQQEYDLKLQQSLQELRAEYEAQLSSYKEQFDGLYNDKVADLKVQLERVQSSSASKSEELSALSTRYESLSKSSANIESERLAYVNKIKDLERKIDLDHGRFATILSERDNEIDSQIAARDALMSDYQDLMGIKVALDNELATYRKLLEREERRLRLLPKRAREEETHAAVGSRHEIPYKRQRSEDEYYDAAEDLSRGLIHGAQDDQYVEKMDFEDIFQKGGRRRKRGCGIA